MKPETTDEYFEWLRTPDGGSCVAVKELPGGFYGAVKRLIYHYTLIIGEIGNRDNFMDRYCYQDGGTAIAALAKWEGEGDPEGWFRHPATARRRRDGDPAQEYRAA